MRCCGVGVRARWAGSGERGWSKRVDRSIAGFGRSRGIRGSRSADRAGVATSGFSTCTRIAETVGGCSAERTRVCNTDVGGGVVDSLLVGGVGGYGCGEDDGLSR